MNQWRLRERPCTPASGRGKGQVGSQVGTVRQRFFSPRLRVKRFEELNALLIDEGIAWAKANPHPELTDRSVREVFEAERPQPVPHAGRFDGFHSVPAAVSKTCLVRFDSDEDQELIQWINSLRNKYAVTASAAGRPVEIRAHAERIEIRQGEPSRRHRFEPDGERASSGIAPAVLAGVGPSAIRGTMCPS